MKKNDSIPVLWKPTFIQELHKTVYSQTRKEYFNQASDNWLTSDPGNTIILYDIQG